MTYPRRILPFALILLFAGSAYSQFPKVEPKDLRNSPAMLQAFRTIVAKPREATVRIYADGKDVAFGVVVDPAGFVLTKWDEVRDHSEIHVKFKDGKSLRATIVGVKDDKDGAYDLALLKVKADKLAAIEWAPTKDARVGRWVASVGTGEDPVAIGVVSVAARKWQLGDQPPRNTNANAGFLGVSLQDADGKGAKVTGVEPKSPAEKAKLKVEDVIYEAAGKKIIDTETLINTIGRLRPNDKVVLKVKRGSENIDIEAMLGKRPAFGNPQETMGAKLSNRRGGFPAIIQHDSGIRPEDCGGPLVDLEGKAVGLNIARAGRTETYAIPSDDILKLLPDLKSGKLAPQPGGTLSSKADPNQIFRFVGSLGAKDQPIKAGKGKLMKVHEVKLSAGVTYIIEMDSTEIDSYLILEDPKGAKLAEDDDSGGFPNAKIVHKAASDGVYRVIATTFNPNETGTYTLSVRKQE